MVKTPSQYVPRVDSFVQLDGRSIGERLLPGDDFSDSGYPGCAFRFPSFAAGGSVAVNVDVTGRTLQRRNGAYWVRVNVEFVGDCEPSSFHGGWMLVR